MSETDPKPPCPFCGKRPVIQNPFVIVDHCFEPHKHEPEDIEYRDQCAYQNCGRPEIEHFWTVEAYMSNKQALDEGI